MEHESESAGRFINKRTSGDHPNYSIVEIGQNTEKSPGDLRRLAVTQTRRGKPPVYAGRKNFQTSKILMIMIIIILLEN